MSGFGLKDNAHYIDMIRNNIPMSVSMFKTINLIDDLVDCPQAATPRQSTVCEEKKAKKKGSPMYDLDCCTDNFSKAETALSHLANRTSTVFHKKEWELRNTFNLDNDDPPVTAKELIDRISAGKYEVKEDRLNDRVYDPTRHFIWRDPSKKRDEEGFKAAMKELNKARTQADDIIVVMSDEAAQLKALQDFEATTIQ